MAFTKREQALAEIKGLSYALYGSTQEVLERVREARDEFASRQHPVVAFVHIPMTAGTVTSVFDAAYSSRAAVQHAGKYLEDPERAAARVARPRMGSARVTIGQVPYDLLREHLPADTRYMTLVREPVDRVLSHYYRRIHRTGTPLDERRPVTADSLEEALQMRLPHITNLATRFLCGEPSPSGELPGSALDQAKANLREFEVVGIDEQLDESIVLLQRAVGLGLIPYEDLRVSSDGPARLDSAPPTAGEIPDEQRDLIVEHNQLDVELYAFAQGLFEDAVSAGNEGLAADAERLRALSEAATEEALQDAREWLDRELPPGGTKALSELRARARADGISLTAFRHEAPQRLAVESHLDDDGQWKWTRVAEK